MKTIFPGWSAPWVGAAVCGGIALKVIREQPELSPEVRPAFIIGAVVVGFVIGLALWLRDRKRGD